MVVTIRPVFFRVIVAALGLVAFGCSSTGPQPTPEAPPLQTEVVDLSADTVVAVNRAPLSPESVLLAEAEQYQALAVTAASRREFDEAEYNFEKALELLAKLDPETSFTEAEEAHIAALLDQIGEDYGNTIRARGDRRPSPEMSAFMMRFEDLESLRDWREYAQMQRALEPESVTYNIPVVWNERVKNCIFYFQTIARANMEVYLTRAGIYLPLMKQIFAGYDMPTDLCYLPIVESGFNPRAYSYARASGPWQFIASTGKTYGLDRDWWRDERRDFVRSTHSAARYLKYLYGLFDDWYLALAAYNGGEGRVGRTIRKQNTRDFWEMRLRKQTENYVPLYLAALIIAKDPERFGFYVEPYPPISFDVTRVDKPIELTVVARHIGCSVQELKDLNPELLRGVTPPRQSRYDLRVPDGLGKAFAVAYDKIPQSERTEWVKHTIRRGESLSTIAQKYGVSVRGIKDANRLTSNRIIAGRQLVIPVPVGYRGGSTKRTIVASSDGQYRVRPGDTMWDIARVHGTSVERLAGMNNISSRRKIYPGQILRVPASSASASATPAQKTPARTYGSYRVRPGDTLWDIARRHRTSVSNLAQLNNISSRGRIYPGQILRVPGGATQESSFTYVVRRGDNLTRIANRFGIGVSDILALNSLADPEQLHVGTRLVIPETR
jgi:membrane-bound lytic murein transglycosylase D